ncbi:hypothetical protein, partial [Heyndrickxia coagulans]|uniref:hypothetical protein n=1 Tax=Heyndrickxia coagulans TaxID=1398 RepID=UPI00214D7AB8
THTYQRRKVHNLPYLEVAPYERRRTSTSAIKGGEDQTPDGTTKTQPTIINTHPKHRGLHPSSADFSSNMFP